MQVGDEYRLQTREGSEWDREFRNRQTQARTTTTPTIQIQARPAAVRARSTGSIRAIKVIQGAAKEPRQFLIHRETRRPASDGEQHSDLDSGWLVLPARKRWSMPRARPARTARSSSSSSRASPPTISAG